MYFVRVPQDSKYSGIVAITPQNTFCFCEMCGRTFPVDLMDYVGDEHFDLYDPGELCDQCIEELSRNWPQKRINEQPIVRMMKEIEEEYDDE